MSNPARPAKINKMKGQQMKNKKKIDWEAIAEYLECTCNTITQSIDYFGLNCDPETVQDKMLDFNIEVCPGCGWWVESGELADDNGNIVECYECRFK